MQYGRTILTGWMGLKVLVDLLLMMMFSASN